MDLDELLRRAQLLSNNFGVGNNNNPIEVRPTHEALQRAKELQARASKYPSVQVEAKKLLSSQGIDLSVMTEKLNNLKMPEPLEPNLTIEQFIRNETEKAKFSVMEESSSDRIFELDKESIKKEYSEEKAMLLCSLTGPSKEFMDLRSISEQIVIDKKKHAYLIKLIDTSYAQVVIDYNEAKLKGDECPELIEKIANVAKDFHDENPDDLWTILEYMTAVPCDPIKRHREPDEIVMQAKSFLENQYKSYMSLVVSKDEKFSGSHICSLIKRFVWKNWKENTKIGFVDMKGGMALWPHVYYAMRCNEMEVVKEFLCFFDYKKANFMRVIEEKIECPGYTLDSQLWTEMNLFYTNYVKNSEDPFQKVSFCLILGIDEGDGSFAEVIQSFEDFLWFKLSILTVRRKEWDFALLQSLIIDKYGERYFKASKKPHIYSQALLLTGQFEAAIEFMLRSEEFRAHAVHIALALNELGALSISTDAQSPLLYADRLDPFLMKRLNLVQLIITYAKSFENNSMVKEAMHYYFFLHEYNYSDSRNVFEACVCDLATKTLAFETIFGQINGNGQIEDGLLIEFIDPDVCKNIAVMLAEQLVARNKSENAIYLFHLTGLDEKTFKSINELLSQCANLYPFPNSLCDRVTQIVLHYKERLEDDEFPDIEPQTEKTFMILFTFLEFFNFFHKKNYHNALTIITDTGLIPVKGSDIIDCFRNIEQLSEEVYKVYLHVLLSVMNIYYTVYLEAKQSLGTAKESEIQLNPLLIEIRNLANTLNCMVSTVPFKMSDMVVNQLLEIGNSMK